MHYTFFLPSAAFGGLEMQMAVRAADAIRNGDSSLFVGIPGPPARLALSLGVPVETLRVKRDYVDLVAAFRLGRMMKRAASNVCIVAESKHLSLAILARRLVLPTAKEPIRQIFFFTVAMKTLVTPIPARE